MFHPGGKTIKWACSWCGHIEWYPELAAKKAKIMPVKNKTQIQTPPAPCSVCGEEFQPPGDLDLERKAAMNANERVKEFCQGVSYTNENLFVRKLRAGGLSDEQIVVVIEAMGSTCNGCWDDERGCQCRNDE
jgi:hypothetical protein